MESPTQDEVRQALAHFDTRRQKIVAGLFSVMIQNTDRIRDREWVARQLTEIVTMAGGFDGESPDGSIAAVHEFLEGNAAELLSASFLLFQRVGMDLAPRADEGFNFEDALQVSLSYLPT